MPTKTSLELQTGPVLAAGGDAVAHHPDGRVVFVDGAAPNEHVRVVVERDNRSFLRARVVEILERGPSRVTPRCALFGTCGGCSLQHVSAEAQLASKHQQLKDALLKIARLDLAAVTFDAPWAGPAYRYRARARLTALAQAGRVVVGFRRRGSREVIEVRDCPVLLPELERAIGVLAAELTSVRREESLDLVAAEGRVSAGVSRRLLDDHPRLKTLLDPKVGDVEPLRSDDPLGPLLLQPGVFAQSNPEGNIALLAHVRALLESAPAFQGRVLELYSGSGNFTRVLAERAARVVAVEGAKEAVRLARAVLPDRVELMEEPVEVALEKLVLMGARFDAALLDPPRGGAGRDVPRALVSLGVSRVVAVGCDLSTWARDVGRFRDAGLMLTRARIFDLYPQTPHAEVAGLLERSGDAGGSY